MHRVPALEVRAGEWTWFMRYSRVPSGKIELLGLYQDEHVSIIYLDCSLNACSFRVNFKGNGTPKLRMSTCKRWLFDLPPAPVRKLSLGSSTTFLLLSQTYNSIHILRKRLGHERSLWHRLCFMPDEETSNRIIHIGTKYGLHTNTAY